MRSDALNELVRRARAERAGLRAIWDQGKELRGREQAWLARDLAAIQPATVEDKNGNRRRCESPFHLKRPDKSRIARAMLADGESDAAVRRWVGVSQSTVRRLKRPTETPKAAAGDGLLKRSDASKSANPVHGPTSTRKRPQGVAPPAYLDATSGANVEAESRFLKLVDSPLTERHPSASTLDSSRPGWHLWVYGGRQRHSRDRRVR